MLTSFTFAKSPSILTIVYASRYPLSTMILQMHARIQSFLDEPPASKSPLGSVQRQTAISLDVVSAALQKYDISELAVSYNGGKDCLVLLVLFLGGLGRRLSQQQNQRRILSLETHDNLEPEFEVEVDVFQLYMFAPPIRFQLLKILS